MINYKMPVNIGTFSFISRNYFMIMCVEQVKGYIAEGPGVIIICSTGKDSHSLLISSYRKIREYSSTLYLEVNLRCVGFR